MKVYKAWLPDKDWDETDAKTYKARNAEHAAEKMCEDHWCKYDGCEWGIDEPFEITVKGPDGKITRFEGVHEEIIEHNVSEIEEEEGEG